MFFDVGLIPLWLEVAGVIEPRSSDIQKMPIERLLGQADEGQTAGILKTYLSELNQAGFPAQRQGIWMQTDNLLLGASNGSSLFPGASLTKAATTLATLHHYPISHQFQTQIQTTGTVKDGVLQGDLILQGGIDLLFMRPQAMDFGNRLTKLGIQIIEGNLIILFPHQAALPNPEDIGKVLRESMNESQWSAETQRQYQQHRAGQEKPNITIQGEIQTFRDSTAIATPLMTHSSPPVIEMLKYMNVHSNNQLAESLVAEIGGVAVLVNTVTQASDLPEREVQLKNGSGLGSDNQMSPRAVVGIFQAIQTKLSATQLNLERVFPVSGQDIGTLEDRDLPKGAVVKTGTLWNVSALAGSLPTPQKRRVWFAIMNEGGGNISGFRRGQDRLLTQLAQNWSKNNLISSSLNLEN